MTEEKLSESEDWRLEHPAKRFSSVILNEEIEGFNQIASHYTEDILTTIEALSEMKKDDVLIETRYRMPNVDPPTPADQSFSQLILDLFVQNFYIGELVGSLLHSAELPEVEWIYAYSRNETLLNLPISELKQIKDLKMYYLQLDSQTKCMPVGGPLGYDTFMVYMFINLVGYGQNAGYLKTWFRDEESTLEIDFKNELAAFGSRGDGLWGHAKCKAYMIFDCLYELTQMLLLILVSCKILVHSLTRIQTKQMFARHTNFNEGGAAAAGNNNQQNQQ